MDVKDILRKYGNDQNLLQGIRREIFQNNNALDELEKLPHCVDITNNDAIKISTVFNYFLKTKIVAQHLLNLFRNYEYFKHTYGALAVTDFSELEGSQQVLRKNEKPSEATVLRYLVDYTILFQILCKMKQEEIAEETATLFSPKLKSWPTTTAEATEQKLKRHPKKQVYNNGPICIYCDSTIPPGSSQCPVCEAAVERAPDRISDSLSRQIPASIPQGIRRPITNYTVFSSQKNEKRKSIGDDRTMIWECTYCDEINDSSLTKCHTCNGEDVKINKIKTPFNSEKIISENGDKGKDEEICRRISTKQRVISNSVAPISVHVNGIVKMPEPIYSNKKPENQDYGWACSACGFKNIDKATINCFACYASKIPINWRGDSHKTKEDIPPELPLRLNSLENTGASERSSSGSSEHEGDGVTSVSIDHQVTGIVSPKDTMPLNHIVSNGTKNIPLSIYQRMTQSDNPPPKSTPHNIPLPRPYSSIVPTTNGYHHANSTQPSVDSEKPTFKINYVNVSPASNPHRKSGTEGGTDSLVVPNKEIPAPSMVTNGQRLASKTPEPCKTVPSVPPGKTTEGNHHDSSVESSSNSNASIASSVGTLVSRGVTAKTPKNKITRLPDFADAPQINLKVKNENRQVKLGSGPETSPSGRFSNLDSATKGTSGSKYLEHKTTPQDNMSGGSKPSSNDKALSSKYGQNLPKKQDIDRHKLSSSRQYEQNQPRKQDVGGKAASNQFEQNQHKRPSPKGNAPPRYSRGYYNDSFCQSASQEIEKPRQASTPSKSRQSPSSPCDYSPISSDKPQTFLCFPCRKKRLADPGSLCECQKRPAENKYNGLCKKCFTRARNSK